MIAVSMFGALTPAPKDKQLRGGSWSFPKAMVCQCSVRGRYRELEENPVHLCRAAPACRIRWSGSTGFPAEAALAFVSAKPMVSNRQALGAEPRELADLMLSLRTAPIVQSRLRLSRPSMIPEYRFGEPAIEAARRVRAVEAPDPVAAEYGLSPDLMRSRHCVSKPR